MTTEKFQETMNQILVRTGLYTRSPRYRYYTRPGSKDRYFYTTEKTEHNGRLRYVAGIYRHLKSRNVYKLVKRSGFAKRYKADETAKRYRDRESKQKATPPEVTT